jgi:trehalose/maltose hydrolase-like predicted phosphorylase
MPLAWRPAAARATEDPPLDRRFEAIILAGDAAATAEPGTVPAWPTPAIAELSAAGAQLRRLLPAGAADWTELRDAITGALEDLAADGIGPGLVLVIAGPLPAGDADAGSGGELLGPQWARAVLVDSTDEAAGAAGSSLLADILSDQVAMRRAGRVPDVDLDPAWAVTVDERPWLVAAESLLTVADGLVGTRGVLEEVRTSAAVRVNGIYDDSVPLPCPNLLAGPTWTSLRVTATESRPGRRVLDLRTGVVHRAGGGDGSLRSLRFAALARPGTAAMRVEGAAGSFTAPDPLTAPPGGAMTSDSDGRLVARANAPHGGIVAAARQQQCTVGDRSYLERLAVYAADPVEEPAAALALDGLGAAEAAGFDALLAEQRSAWAHRWTDCQVDIEGDPETELAVRFALFHLLASAKGSGETALGARGLSGPGYAGHVFWDADIFALPTLAALFPEAARAMLEYRLRRLQPARENAARTGRAGARFPWESACEGTECTPTAMVNDVGEVIEILTGEMEEHIVADVAWAAWRYADWTGDEAFRTGAGAPLLVETARYWASRIELDDAGRGHLRRVIGPDEYHEGVDDNAFTNVMARWNLRRAAELVERTAGGAPPLAGAEEVATWRAIADSIVDGYDPDSGRYEQYDGFYRLEPFIVSDVLQLPAAADLVLGRDVTLVSQIVKQADVLMMQFLVPDEVAPGSLVPNLDYYGPRTSHGSSLSPAVHAGVMARAGRPDEGLRLLRMAAQLDLRDLTHTTATGLHIATFGGLWQAIATGFAGITVHDGALGVDPQLPSSWQRLTVRLRYHDRRVCLRLRGTEVDIETDGPMTLRLPNDRRVQVAAPGARFGGPDWTASPGPSAPTKTGELT